MFSSTHSLAFQGNDHVLSSNRLHKMYDHLVGERFRGLDVKKQLLSQCGKAHIDYMRNNWIIVHWFWTGDYEVWKPLEVK